MLLFAIIALFFYCIGGHSAPNECPKLSCKNAIYAIFHSLNKSKISTWHTHAINITEDKFVNCNLDIFKNDFNNQWKKENCSNNINMNIPECQVYKGIECIPHNCQPIPIPMDEADLQQKMQTVDNSIAQRKPCATG